MDITITVHSRLIIQNIFKCFNAVFRSQHTCDLVSLIDRNSIGKNLFPGPGILIDSGHRALPLPRLSDTRLQFLFQIFHTDIFLNLSINCHPDSIAVFRKITHLDKTVMPVRFIKTVREGIRINHADRIAEPEETRQRLECLLIHLDFTQYICLVFFRL